MEIVAPILDCITFKQFCGCIAVDGVAMNEMMVRITKKRRSRWKWNRMDQN
jgi:hypothetical protein